MSTIPTYEEVMHLRDVSFNTYDDYLNAGQDQRELRFDIWQKAAGEYDRARALFFEKGGAL